MSLVCASVYELYRVLASLIRARLRDRFDFFYRYDPDQDYIMQRVSQMLGGTI